MVFYFLYKFFIVSLDSVININIINENESQIHLKKGNKKHGLGSSVRYLSRRIKR